MRGARPLAPPDEALLHGWPSGWATPDIATRHELAGWARDSGSERVELDDITLRMRPSLRRPGRMTTLGFPIHRTLRTLRLRSVKQRGNVRSARDQYRALQRGIWFCGILTGAVPE